VEACTQNKIDLAAGIVSSHSDAAISIDADNVLP
jgi:hypothetical protein